MTPIGSIWAQIVVKDLRGVFGCSFTLTRKHRSAAPAFTLYVIRPKHKIAPLVTFDQDKQGFLIRMHHKGKNAMLRTELPFEQDQNHLRGSFSLPGMDQHKIIYVIEFEPDPNAARKNLSHWDHLTRDEVGSPA